MRICLRSLIRIALPCLLVAFSSGLAHAQGSGGGSISNDDKALSGSRESSRSTEPSKPARQSPEPRRSYGGGGGGGSGSFDGAWMVNSRGGTMCPGSVSAAVIVTSGKIIGESARGTVSPNGSVSATASGNGISIVTTGRLSGRSGGGSFRQSDGCVGTWTASKQ